MPRSPASAPRARRPPPDAGSLQEAALAHLARFASTEASLTRVLARRIERWAREAEEDPDRIEAVCRAARAAVSDVVARLVAAGAVSDAAFAESRARSLAHAGRSRRAIGAHLARSGVPAELARQATPDDEGSELAAALVHARRRRMGPWRPETSLKMAAADIHRRELANLARAGYPHQVAKLALSYDRDEAEALIASFRAR
jgi:regulatory protein